MGYFDDMLRRIQGLGAPEELTEMSEEERATLRAGTEMLYAMEKSGGWAHLKELVMEEAHRCMTKTLEKIPERDRDYLASRIQTLDWLLSLPKEQRRIYNRALEVAEDDPSQQPWGEAEGLCPVPKEG